MNISETLKEKVGPLPVWAWGVMLGLIVVGGMYWFRSRTAMTNAQPMSETIAYPDIESAGISQGAALPTVDTGSSGLDFPNNMLWQTAAMARLIAQGYNPLDVQAALELYLAGETLTAKQAEIVEAALRLLGLPPQGTAGPPVVLPKPTPVTRPVPVLEDPLLIPPPSNGNTTYTPPRQTVTPGGVVRSTSVAVNQYTNQLRIWETRLAKAQQEGRVQDARVALENVTKVRQSLALLGAR